MNQVIRYGSVQAIPIYNCSAHTPEEWTKRDGVSRPILGITEASLGILINICYIPIIFVMLEKEHFKISCYKIMSFLAIIDMLSIVVDCIITGWLAYQGAVFCSYPTLIYFSGMSGTGLWCCTCVTALILIVNRIFDLLVPRARIFFFEGNRTFLVILGAILYTMYYVFCNTPSLFTSKFHSWFFTPMIFEGRDMDYENVPMFFNNIGVVFVTCILYILFCFVLGAKLKNVSTGSESRSASIQIFFQSAMICAFNLMASLIYISMNYIEVPFWLIILGQFSWQLGNSAPVFIYMKFNKTLRNGVLKNLGIKKGRKMSMARRGTLTTSKIHSTQVTTIS